MITIKNSILVALMMLSTITFAQAKFRHYDSAERQDRKTGEKFQYTVDGYSSIDLKNNILFITEGDSHRAFLIQSETLSEFEFNDIKCYSYEVISADGGKTFDFTSCDNGVIFLGDENIRTMYYLKKIVGKK